MTNGYLVNSPSSTIAIDAPQGFRAWIQSMGAKPSALLLTHSHYDHVMDAAALKRQFDCPIFAFAPHSSELTLEHRLAEFGIRDTLAPYSVDHILAEQSSIEIGDFRFQILHVPGHSPDSICFLCEQSVGDDRASLYGGDVLFRGGIGRTDLDHGDHHLLIRGIREKLFALDQETTVYPGHGPATTLIEERLHNPFVAD